MDEYKVRFNPAETVICKDYTGACALADPYFVYGSVVTDTPGKLFYAPQGKVGSTILTEKRSSLLYSYRTL